jgi:mono/diheme cytochrome c family protein
MSDESKKSSEEALPRMGNSSLPVGLVIVLGMLLYRSMMFLDSHGGGFNAMVYAPYPSLPYVVALRPIENKPAWWDMGVEVYKNTCAPCHQATGLGAPGVAPPLVGSEWVAAEKPDRLIRIVLNGVQGPIMVKGQEWNLAMVPWRDSLNDEQIAAVISVIRGNKEWNHNAGPVTPEQVKAVRAATADKGAAWTADELTKIAE